MNVNVSRCSLLVAASLSVGSALAQSFADRSGCAAIESDKERLACYDRANARQPTPAAASPSHVEPAGRAPAGRSALEERWAIGRDTGNFVVLPHEPTYLLFGRYSDNVNQRPASPTRPGGPVDLGLKDVEAKYQLSFKFRVLETSPSWAPDLWVGYTQQSHWQVYTADRSRPFRETNYSPELMFAWHPDVAVGPMRLKLVNMGLVHQSNGRTEVLSRSWNRLYAQIGLEAGNFMLLVRPWVRLSESAAKDDNPDVRDFLGHGDVVLSYRWRDHSFATKLRQNFRTGRGFAEASWRFPLGMKVSGYLQATTGYGESLIDYNRHQNTIGLGVALFDWQ